MGVGKHALAEYVETSTFTWEHTVSSNIYFSMIKFV